MHVEHHGVAGRDHRERVVDHRLGRVGARGDGEEHTERRSLVQGEAVVAGEDERLEDLHPRRLLDGDAVLHHLVGGAPQTGLLGGEPRDLLDAREARGADRGDAAGAHFQSGLAPGLERTLRARDGAVEIVVHSPPGSADERWGPRDRCLVAHPRDDLVHQPIDLLGSQRHRYFS